MAHLQQGQVCQVVQLCCDVGAILPCDLAALGSPHANTIWEKQIIIH